MDLETLKKFLLEAFNGAKKEISTELKIVDGNVLLNFQYNTGFSPFEFALKLESQKVDDTYRLERVIEDLRRKLSLIENPTEILLPLALGWTPYASSEYDGPKVIKQGKFVCVSGLISGNVWGHLATLPEGFRPTKRLVFAVNNHQLSSRVDVCPNGNIYWIDGGKSHGWISLSGISFYTT